MKQKTGRKLLSWLLTLAMVIGLMPGMSLTAYAAEVPYASLKNTTNVINFDGKEWYLIYYDESTVTLLSKECVGASKFDSNGSSNTYSGSTVENFVNGWYTDNISVDAKAAVNGSGAFLLTTEQARPLSSDVLKCSMASGAIGNYWWLCTPATAGDVVCGSGELGSVTYGGRKVSYTFGVRPALKLDLSKVTFASVSLSGGANASTSGDSSIKNTFFIGTIPEMTTITYTANEGYKFPAESNSYGTSDGITVTRTSDTCVTVSGTPTGVVNVTIPDAVQSSVAVTDVTLSKTSTTLTVGDTEKLAATVNPDDATDKTVTWLSDKESVATVSDGVVTAVAVGTATITVTATNGTDDVSDDKTATCTVTVGAAKPTIAIFPTDAGTVTVINHPNAELSNSWQLTATPASGYVFKEWTYKWNNSQGSSQQSYQNNPYSLNKSYYNNGTITELTAVFELDGSGSTATVTKAPEAKTLTYNGQEQALVNAGTVQGGTMQYALGENATTAPADDLYTTSIPTATNAGTYFVWYKALGDATHSDSNPAVVTITISEETPAEPEIEEGYTEAKQEGSAHDDEKTSIDNDLTEIREIVSGEAPVDDSDTVRLILNTNSVDENADENKEAVDSIKSKIEADNLNIGSFLDITLSFIVEDANGTKKSSGQLAELNGRSLSVRFPIPSKLQASGRLFRIFRFHGGKAEEVGSGRGDAVVLSLDKFSLYAIAYEDGAATEETEESEKKVVKPHTHTYAWDKVEATESQDGELRYQCTECYDILVRVPLSAYYVFNANTVDKINKAKQGETVKITTDRWISFHKMVFDALAARPDVSLEISFLDGEYKGNRVSFTIPAGADNSDLFTENNFAGFMYLGNKYGLTAEEN